MLTEVLTSHHTEDSHVVNLVHNYVTVMIVYIFFQKMPQLYSHVYNKVVFTRDLNYSVIQKIKNTSDLHTSWMLYNC